MICFVCKKSIHRDILRKDGHIYIYIKWIEVLDKLNPKNRIIFREGAVLINIMTDALFIINN